MPQNCNMLLRNIYLLWQSVLGKACKEPRKRGATFCLRDGRGREQRRGSGPGRPAVAASGLVRHGLAGPGRADSETGLPQKKNEKKQRDKSENKAKQTLYLCLKKSWKRSNRGWGSFPKSEKSATCAECFAQLSSSAACGTLRFCLLLLRCCLSLAPFAPIAVFFSRLFSWLCDFLECSFFLFTCV